MVTLAGHRLPLSHVNALNLGLLQFNIVVVMMRMQASRSVKQGNVPKSAAKPSKAKANAKRRGATARYDAIRSDLERQRVGLLDEAAAALMNLSDLEAFPDLSDQATAEFDQSFGIRLKEREQKLVKKIDEALGRITANIYGICEDCGEVIPYERLKARPVTTLCIRCKTTQEEQEKIRG